LGSFLGDISGILNNTVRMRAPAYGGNRWAQRRATRASQLSDHVEEFVRVRLIGLAREHESGDLRFPFRQSIALEPCDDGARLDLTSHWRPT